jgi:hypothetical protein
MLSSKMLSVYPSDRAVAGLVLGHGAGGGQQSRFMVEAARAFAARGITTATFDFPYVTAGRKVPDKAPVLEGSWRDAMAAARAHAAFAGLPLFIGGKSMGGRIASHLAAAGDPAAGLVCLGYPLHPPKQPEKLRVAHLPNLKLPTLVLQGKRDEFGSPDDLRAHFPPHVEIIAMPGGHSFDKKALPEAQRLVADFILR